jgi:hypothetical protein
MAYCLLSMEIPSARREGNTHANACEIEAGRLAGLDGRGGNFEPFGGLKFGRNRRI